MCYGHQKTNRYIAKNHRHVATDNRIEGLVGAQGVNRRQNGRIAKWSRMSAAVE